jgi:hypothetical protein
MPSQSMLSIEKSQADGIGPGILKILELTSGKYELYKWDLFLNLGMIQSTKYPKREFSMPFEVKPDTINYIGQLVLNTDGSIFCISDKNERDIKILLKSYPILSELPVNYIELKCVSGCNRGDEKNN